MNRHLHEARRAQSGFTLIEILVTLVITAFGLLGLAGFVVKATALSVDATQRARASALLSDMASRLANNKANAAAYVSANIHGSGVQNCAALAVGPARDLCDWNNLLAGTNDARPGGNAAFFGYRGCVTQPNPADPVYIVTVTWGSITPGAPPSDACAAGAFGDESLRRVLRSQVRVANLLA